MRRRWLVQTMTGSLYVVEAREDGTWWMAANNVISPTSHDVSGQVWEIEKPVQWPPRLGRHMMLLSPKEFAKNSPLRMPGGGKHTSPVVDFDYVEV